MEGKEQTSSSLRIQTRSGPRKEKANKRCCDMEDDSSGAVQMAPTAKLQKHKHELELAKMKIACQEDLIKELTKERDFLKDQLSQTSRNMRNDDPSPEANTYADFSGSSESSSESTDPSSDSSVSSSSSTSEDRKKRKRKKKNTKKKKGKKGTRERRSKRRSILRARGPDEVIARYRKVLKIVGVDRNTITLNAPIAELSIAAPAKFAEFREEHSIKQKLGDFAGKCLLGVCDDPDIQSKVHALKKARKLLPVGKGDF